MANTYLDYSKWAFSNELVTFFKKFVVFVFICLKIAKKSYFYSANR
jgi:hypothetical protein